MAAADTTTAVLPDGRVLFKMGCLMKRPLRTLALRRDATYRLFYLWGDRIEWRCNDELRGIMPLTVHSRSRYHQKKMTLVIWDDDSLFPGAAKVLELFPIDPLAAGAANDMLAWARAVKRVLSFIQQTHERVTERLRRLAVFSPVEFEHVRRARAQRRLEYDEAESSAGSRTTRPPMSISSRSASDNSNTAPTATTGSWSSKGAAVSNDVCRCAT